MAKKATISKCPVCDRLIAYRDGRFYRHYIVHENPVSLGPVCQGSGQSLQVLRELKVRNV